MAILLIEQAIAEQNPHWSGERYTHDFHRIHDETALDDFALDEMQIITGIRCCGKSTLMQTIMNHLMEAHNPKQALYINFDDPNYTAVCNDPKNLYDIVTAAEKLTGSTIDYLFLDEIQNVVAWEQYAKSMYDSKRFKKIVVTGSNADLLNSNYASLLTGRYIEKRLHPMSFLELLLNNGINDQHLLIKRKSQVLTLLDEMLQYGGFPRIHQLKSHEQRRKILKSYYETILLKDCINNHSVRDTRTMMALAFYLVSNCTACYSYNSLSKAVDSNENTVKEFIQIYENTYFLRELRQYAYSLKKQMRMKKKIYCADNGLINAATFSFSDNFGKLLENLVYTELQKNVDADIFLYNEGKECDFILMNTVNPLAVQVCYDLNEQNREREISGLKSAMEAYDIPQGIIITYDQEEHIADQIQAIPFWKFFSKNPFYLG